ncbi:MAG: hypothetical protein LC108_08415 [Anaerolineales bacterium]|nr:hypothetical protein [Anaerolineales bacterium]
MADETKNDPAKKMRRLLNGGKNSPMIKLPKKNSAATNNLPKQTAPPAEETPSTTALKKPNPAEKKAKPAAKKLALPPLPKNIGTLFKKLQLNFWPPFWTIASVISLTVNIVLLIVMLALLSGLRKSGMQLSSIINLGSGFLGGLYTNFEKMDRASITTDVKVDTTIPVKFDLQLNQQTNVVLSQDVTINNARVTVNTGGLNISNALTTIILPQGTSLPVVLNLTVPVDTTVPVTLNVPVNIPLSQTQLHEPFAGLQDVVRPFYCMLAPSAVNLEGQPVCP